MSITRANRSEEFGRECNSQLCSTAYLITPKRAESMGRGRGRYPKTMNSHGYIYYYERVDPSSYMEYTFLLWVRCTHALPERLVSRRGAESSAQRFETRDERSDTRSDAGIHMSYYGINSSPMKEGSWLD